MSASLLFFYLSIVLGYVALRPLCTLVHETGHLLFLLSTGQKGPISVYIGSLGARKGTLRIRLGRITWVIHPSCLLMRGSLCDFENPLRSHLIPGLALSGPIASLAIAVLSGSFLLGLGGLDPAYWLKPILILMALIPLLDFLLSLFYRYETIQLSAEIVTANDGQLLAWWLGYGKMTTAFLHGAWLFEKERYAEATQALQEVKSAGKATAEVYEFLVFAALAVGDPQETIRQFQEMATRHAPDPFDRCRYAAALEQTGQRPEAMAQLNQALKIAPGHSEALNLRAYLSLADGNLDSAKADLHLAIISQKDFAPALCTRGGLHLQLGNLEAARNDLQTSMREDAETPELHFHWAGYHLQSGKFEAASSALETARLLGLDKSRWAEMEAKLGQQDGL